MPAFACALMGVTTKMTSGGWLTQLKFSLLGTVKRMGVCYSHLLDFG